MKIFILHISIGILFIISSCKSDKKSSVEKSGKINLPDKFLLVLGVAQDAGYPQIGCTKECCTNYWERKEEKKHSTCLALVDRKAGEYWLFEATPDITYQLHTVQPYLSTNNDYSPDGIFISHAHIGHYSGLMQLGKEAMGSNSVTVWGMPRLDSFLKNNGPWSQLVSLHNIELKNLKDDSTVWLNTSLKVTPFKVPHRDEFSETVGFVIESSKKKILFIPDIDKWEKWATDIVEKIKDVDVALLDGTFYKNGELPGRDMKEVPHPFVEESMQLFSSLSTTEKSKIVFIHFNHTNPLLKKKSAEKKNVRAKGFDVAGEGQIIEL